MAPRSKNQKAKTLIQMGKRKRAVAIAIQLRLRLPTYKVAIRYQYKRCDQRIRRSQHR